DASAARRLSLGGGPALDTAARRGLISPMRNRLLPTPGLKVTDGSASTRVAIAFIGIACLACGRPSDRQATAGIDSLNQRLVLARLERQTHDGVRQVRRLPAPPGGRPLADGPLLRLRGLDSAALNTAMTLARDAPGHHRGVGQRGSTSSVRVSSRAEGWRLAL